MIDHRVDITVQGTVNHPLVWTALCVCGWRSMAPDQREIEHQGDVHRRVAAMTVICDGCADVVPARMTEQAGTDMLCPECFVEPVADPTEVITDLQRLERELRPVPWDGS